MNTEACSWCLKKYPSVYYFEEGTPPDKRICRECYATLPPEDRERLRRVSGPPEAAPPTPPLRCLRCEGVMDEGHLARLTEGEAGVQQVRWVGRGEESWEHPGVWSLGRELPVSAWRCGRCGAVELATPPDD